MREDEMTYGPNPTCPICDKPLPAKKGPGAPRMYCCREHSLLNFYLEKVEAMVVQMTEDGTPASALMALRQRLWLAGNALTPRGRKPGTRYLLLTLSCGHQKEIRQRGRLVYGERALDALPLRTRCDECRARKDVAGHEVMTA